MKKFVLSIVAFFVLVTSKAQFSEDFNNTTIPGLTSTCWVVNGMSMTNQSGEAINGTSIYTAPPTNPNIKIDLYTPILTLLSTSSTIEFDYRLTDALNGNATRTILVGLVNTFGNVVSFNSIVMNSSSSTVVQHYTHTFSTSILSLNRVFLRIMGEGGNGNARLVLDNLQASSSSLLGIGGGCVFAPILESALPVKLASFTATLGTNNKANLKWTTTSEINTSHFTVQRSTDGTNFSDAGLVFAYGSADAKTDYNFADNISAISSSVIYYRLASVDIDGKTEYSETRMIRIGKQSANKISITAFPNPVINEVRVTIPNEWQNKQVVYEVLNAYGQVTQKMETVSSSQTETISINNLSRGFYIVKATCEGQSAQQKIVKQ